MREKGENERTQTKNLVQKVSKYLSYVVKFA